MEKSYNKIDEFLKELCYTTLRKSYNIHIFTMKLNSFLSLIALVSLSFCKKDYQCVCTNTNTGNVHGDNTDSTVLANK